MLGVQQLFHASQFQFAARPRHRKTGNISHSRYLSPIPFLLSNFRDHRSTVIPKHCHISSKKCCVPRIPIISSVTGSASEFAGNVHIQYPDSGLASRLSSTYQINPFFTAGDRILSHESCCHVEESFFHYMMVSHTRGMGRSR